ncbi:Protein of unknown function [Sphingobium faniae]|nr:Protein of unknown function [Sphingobium faniae]
MAEVRRLHSEQPRRQGKPEYGCQRLIIAVRAACKRQGIDDDMRKDIQVKLVGKASMSDMSIGDLGRMLDHFNKGWKGPMGHRAHIGKIKALWWSLYWLGAIDEPGDRAISAFVERQTGVSALKFLDHRKAASVIEALKGWLSRCGVEWPTAEEVGTISDHTPGYSDLHADRHAVLNALAEPLLADRVIRGHHSHYLQVALELIPNSHMWTTAELDTAIRLLGRKLRRHRGKEVRD